VEPGVPHPDAIERFREVMDDDFGTPQALSQVFELVREGNRLMDEGADASGLAGAVAEIVDVLGIYDAEPAPHQLSQLSDLEIAELVEARDEARREKRYGEADAIRDRLDAAGVMIEDGPRGTRWIRK